MNEWQSIETAPKDGTRVLVSHNAYGKKHVTTACLSHDATIWDDDDVLTRDAVPHWVVFECDDYYYSQHLIGDEAPTHWMPLPEPPA